MEKRKLTFTITESTYPADEFSAAPAPQFYWHAKLGRITCDGGEGYATRFNAKRAIKALVAHIREGDVELP